MHLLRPDFTQNIYKNIVLESKSINIFGEKGVGKSRFVEDLLTLMDTSIKVVSIDIRPIRNHYDKFVEQINKQLGLDGTETLSEALSYLAINHNQALLIIDNFEELYKDNADKKYDFDFFGELNAFKNISNVSLIILSIKNYAHHNFYHNDKSSTSPLDFQAIEISPLTPDNIEDELKIRCNIDIEYDKLSIMIARNKEIYNFIEFIIREIQFGKYDLETNLYINFNSFKNQFHKENMIALQDKAIHISSLRRVSTLVKLYDISKIFLHDYFTKKNFSLLFMSKKKLADKSFLNPTEGKTFIDEIFQYYSYKKNLAFYLLNVINASKLYFNPLNNNFEIAKSYDKHQPNQSFIEHLKKYKNELNTYHTQNNLQFKKESLQTIIETLKKLEEDMIRETRGWKEYYLKAIRKNLEVAHSELKNLKDKLKNNEPIQANVYYVSQALSPFEKTPTFKGREDMKDALSRAVLTRGTMPLLFIQGQRRVGKTSLINYLEVLLGSGFKIIKIDMQQIRNKKFINLLKNLNREINAKLGIDEVVDFGGDTNDNWIAFEEYLIKHTEQLNYKLIIAFDEYESFHTNIAQKEPEILGYMRGFLQHQAQVIFLFAGLRDIAELTTPNWDEYFPQIQKLRVDYLSFEDSKELIVRPVPNFGLIYDDGVVGEMIELTQGHPQLLQTICSIIVDSANAKGTKNINQAIFEEAKGKIFQTNEAPMSIFWREYCDATQRAIVEEIIAHKPITQDTQAQKRALLRLKEYGFITNENQIRVPLFEKWLIERRELMEIPKHKEL